MVNILQAIRTGYNCGHAIFCSSDLHNAMNKISARKLIVTENLAMIFFSLFMDSVRTSDKQLSIYKAGWDICNGIVFTL